jgi:sporulation protein YlmC with PRC-barrel domain
VLLKFGSACRSRGEHLGTLWGITVEPAEKLVLRVVVEEPQAEPLVRLKVPFSRVEQADADQLLVGLSVREFKAQQPHETDQARARKKAVGRRRRGDEPVERVLTARTRVACREGDVGALAGVQVDARTGDIEGLAVPIGVPLTREVVVPASHVEDIRDERIQLRLGMNDLQDLPSHRS